MNSLPFISLIKVFLVTIATFVLLAVIPSLLGEDFFSSAIVVTIYLLVTPVILGKILNLNSTFLILAALLPLCGFIILIEPDLIPSWIFLLLALFFAVFHLPALWTHVPYFPTPEIADQQISRLIPQTIAGNEKIKFIDLGCGTARLLANLAYLRKDVDFTGYEVSIMPYLIAKLRSFFYPNLQVKFRSFWTVPISQFSVVYAFLSPAPMAKLARKIEKELSPNAIFISNSFPIEGITDYNIQKIDELKIDQQVRGAILLIYKKTTADVHEPG